MAIIIKNISFLRLPDEKVDATYCDLLGVLFAESPFIVVATLVSAAVMKAITPLTTKYIN